MKEYIKQSNLVPTSNYKIKVCSQLPQSAKTDEIVLVKNDGIYNYKNNAWDKIIDFAGGSPGIIGELKIFRGDITDINDDWLYCDGSTFDTTKYPLLYNLLGSDTLPDLRECCLVGAGTNDTDTIAVHDAFTLGELKDASTQVHTHCITINPHGHSANSIANSISHCHCYAGSPSANCKSGGLFGTCCCANQRRVNTFTSSDSMNIVLSCATGTFQVGRNSPLSSNLKPTIDAFCIRYYIRAK